MPWYIVCFSYLDWALPKISSWSGLLQLFWISSNKFLIEMTCPNVSAMHQFFCKIILIFLETYWIIHLLSAYPFHFKWLRLKPCILYSLYLPSSSFCGKSEHYVRSCLLVGIHLTILSTDFTYEILGSTIAALFFFLFFFSLCISSDHDRHMHSLEHGVSCQCCFQSIY